MRTPLMASHPRFAAANTASAVALVIDADEPPLTIDRVSLVTVRAGRLRRRRRTARELDAALAHPTGEPARIADDEAVVGHVLGHHRAGADEGIPPDGEAAQHRAVGAEARAASD